MIPWVVGTWRAPCSLGDMIKAGPPRPPPCLIMAAWEATAACRDWLAICSLGAPWVSSPAANNIVRLDSSTIIRELTGRIFTGRISVCSIYDRQLHELSFLQLILAFTLNREILLVQSSG